MAWFCEYTDTFGGDANYSWVHRAVVGNAPDRKAPEGAKAALKLAREALGLTGIKGDITVDFGDEAHWVPRRHCTILMARWSDDPHEVGPDAYWRS